HQRAPGVDQRNVRADAGKSHRSALVNLDAQPIGDKTHHTRRFHPRDLFQLLFALSQRNEENVAANISAHHFHDLRVRDVVSAGDLDLIARIDAKAPGVFPVAIDGRARSAQNPQNDERQDHPHQPVGSLWGKGSAPDRDALLTSQEWGFLLLFFQIDEPCVVERLTLASLALRNAGKRIQLFLYRGGTGCPRHSFESVVDRKPLSRITITGFRELRHCQVGSDAIENAHVGTDAFVRPAERSSAAARAHGNFEVAAISSFSSIIAPNCETLPAPSVSTMSPGRTSAATEATASEKDAAYATLPFPAPAIRLARASAVIPS